MAGVSLHVKGKVYILCVESLMLYDCETWAVKGDNVKKLESIQKSMMRWRYNAAVREGPVIEKLRGRRDGMHQ